MSGETVTAPRRRENTRARLLEAAEQVFAEVGFDAASVEAVCERAGFTRGAFYSNFASKDEMFLELCRRISEEQIAAIRERIGALKDAGAISGSSAPLPLVQSVLENTASDRTAVLLMSEIRLRALRTPEMAAAWLAQDEALVSSVAGIVEDIVRAGGLQLRLPAVAATRLILSAWESASERAVMQGLDARATRRMLSDALSEIAEALTVAA
jgi:AcrR family transcriptional regulator